MVILFALSDLIKHSHSLNTDKLNNSYIMPLGCTCILFGNTYCCNITDTVYSRMLLYITLYITRAMKSTYGLWLLQFSK